MKSKLLKYKTAMLWFSLCVLIAGIIFSICVVVGGINSSFESTQNIESSAEAENGL